MSASAEVYVSVSSEHLSSVMKVVDVVENHLREVGFAIGDNNYQHSRMISGDIWEVRGHSVSYDVFDQEWADGLTKAIYEVAPEADTEIYVYNLEREADVVSTTMMIKRKANV